MGPQREHAPLAFSCLLKSVRPRPAAVFFPRLLADLVPLSPSAAEFMQTGGGGGLWGHRWQPAPCRPGQETTNVLVREAGTAAANR